MFTNFQTCWHQKNSLLFDIYNHFLKEGVSSCISLPARYLLEQISRHHATGPDSANGRASASGAGGRGFDPGPRHTKGVKNGTSGYLAWRSAL